MAKITKKEEMMLKGTKPKKVEKRLKMFVYGIAGIGKTLAALNFPNAYIIDTEKGTSFYDETINRLNSVVFQSNNPDDIKGEIRELLTVKHGYKTLIIDPITQVYNATQEKWTRTFAKHATSGKNKEIQDFGMRYWGKVKGDFKGLQRLLLSLDMNVIVTAHQKDVYGTGFNKVGVTFDSMKGDDYFFDLIFRIEKKGDKRVAITVKERADLGKNRFPEEFEWSYENFCKFYGKDIIEKDSTPVVMATPEQVKEIQQLVGTVNIEEAVVDRWFTKADVEDWSEMSGEQISKCIDYVQKKLEGLKGKEKGKK